MEREIHVRGNVSSCARSIKQFNGCSEVIGCLNQQPLIQFALIVVHSRQGTDVVKFALILALAVPMRNPDRRPYHWKMGPIRSE